MKICIICGSEIHSSAHKYCSDECVEIGKERKAKQWYKNVKNERKEYNQKYYEENKERQKCVAALWYLRNKEKAKNKAKEYYRDNHTKWQEYNKYNHAAQAGTGFLGPHADVDFEKELKKLENEKRRLRLSF